MTVTLNPEFAHEIVLGVPYVYWLHKQGLLDKVETSVGMKPFYYFCDNVEEKFTTRTLDNNAAGLNNLPNQWIHHNQSVTGLVGDASNGVLDYSKWTPPPYKEVYSQNILNKPYVVVNNTYNIEFGRNERPYRSFDIKILHDIFGYLKENGYIVVYKRPKNTEFTIDQNEQRTLSIGMDLNANVDGIGIINDYELCKYFDNVYLIDDLMEQSKSYNQTQLEIFSGATGFITPNGGGGILCAYFGKPVIMYVPDGKEKRPGYLTNETSYIKMLSNAKVYPIFDNPRDTSISNYDDLFIQIKKVFK